MTNSWTNADGEPIMDGAAWRFEQALDAHYDEYERQFDYYDEDDFHDVDPADCAHEDLSWNTDWHGDESVTNVECDICDTKAVSWSSVEGMPENIVWK